MDGYTDISPSGARNVVFHQRSITSLLGTPVPVAALKSTCSHFPKFQCSQVGKLASWHALMSIPRIMCSTAAFFVSIPFVKDGSLRLTSNTQRCLSSVYYSSIYYYISSSTLSERGVSEVSTAVLTTVAYR